MYYIKMSKMSQENLPEFCRIIEFSYFCRFFTIKLPKIVKITLTPPIKYVTIVHCLMRHILEGLWLSVS